MAHLVPRSASSPWTPQLAANETLDSAALSFLLNRALEERKKREEERRKVKEEEKKAKKALAAWTARRKAVTDEMHALLDAWRRHSCPAGEGGSAGSGAGRYRRRCASFPHQEEEEEEEAEKEEETDESKALDVLGVLVQLLFLTSLSILFFSFLLFGVWVLPESPGLLDFWEITSMMFPCSTLSLVLGYTHMRQVLYLAVACSLLFLCLRSTVSPFLLGDTSENALFSASWFDGGNVIVSPRMPVYCFRTQRNA